MKVDWDDVLAYTTERKVRIRHKWVGGLYYLTALAIASYTCIYQVWLLRGYLMDVPITGSLHASVEPAGSTAPVARLAYCTQSGAHADQQQLPCASFEPLFELVQTAGIGVLVGTRISSTVQLRNESCVRFEYGCNEWLPSTKPMDEYIGDIDSALITVQHSAEAMRAIDSESGLQLVDTFTSPSARHATLEGVGAPPSGLAVRYEDHGDVLTLAQLMRAAGIDLDGAAAAPTNSSDEESTRYAGTTVRVAVEYTAHGYTYHAVESPVQSSRTSVRWANSTSRQVDTIYGVQLVFTQRSRVTQFDVRTLLLTLVAGLALVSAAKTVADFFVLYVSPHRLDYRLFVVDHTPDFGPDSERERKLLAKVLWRKRRKQSMLLTHGLDPEGRSSAHLLHGVSGRIFSSEAPERISEEAGGSGAAAPAEPAEDPWAGMAHTEPKRPSTFVPPSPTPAPDDAE